MPINFVQSGKTLQLKTNSPQLNLHSQETKVDLKKQEGTIDFEKETPALGFYGGGIDEVFIGNEPPAKKSVELWIDLLSNGSSTCDGTDEVFIGDEPPLDESAELWVDLLSNSGSTGGSVEEVSIGDKPPIEDSIKLWIDLLSNGGSTGGLPEVFIGTEEPPTDNFVVWFDTDEDSTQSGSMTIDDFLSLTSKNPVQNKVITKSLNERLEEEQYLTNSEIEKLLGGNS